jgi:hypothetical protein
MSAYEVENRNVFVDQAVRCPDSIQRIIKALFEESRNQSYIHHLVCLDKYGVGNYISSDIMS